MQPSIIVALLTATLLVVSAQTKRPAAISVAKSPLAAAQRRLITIENSQVGGGIKLLDASDIHISGSLIKGSITLQNGCRIQNEIVHECNGRRRRLNAVEKKKLRRRVAQIQKRRRAAKRGARRSAASKTRVGRRPAAASKARPKSKTAHIRRMNAGYTPCNSCPQDDLDGEVTEDPDYSHEDSQEPDDCDDEDFDDNHENNPWSNSNGNPWGNSNGNPWGHTHGNPWGNSNGKLGAPGMPGGISGGMSGGMPGGMPGSRGAPGAPGNPWSISNVNPWSNSNGNYNRGSGAYNNWNNNHNRNHNHNG